LAGDKKYRNMQIDINTLLKPSKWPNSAYVLVTANLLPIIIGLYYGWNFVEFLFLYWFETAIIGFFNIFKMILSSSHPLGQAETRLDTLLSIGLKETRINQTLDTFLSTGLKILMCVFFIFHFGIFMLVHCFFLVGICQEFKLIASHQEIINILLTLKWVVLPLFISHGYSFFTNYLAGGEYKTAKLSVLIQQPYPRIIVMHITLLIGFFIMMMAKCSSVFVVLFVILKTVADLQSHLKEREKFRI
jgi:hypothetical protein